MMPFHDPNPDPQPVSQQERVALHNALSGPKPWDGRLAGELCVQIKTVRRLVERGLLRVAMDTDGLGNVVDGDTRVWVTPTGRVSIAAANESASK
jgi:hypothetical protein